MGTLISRIAMGLLLLLAAGFAIVTTMTGEKATKNSNWEKFSTFFKETRNNTSAYNVEAAGWNVRAIEWTPEENENYRCMFVAGTEKAGVACYPAALKQRNGRPIPRLT